jgi:putative membrane protein
MMGFGFGMGIFGLLLMILFWGGLIALAVWLVSLLFPTAARTPEGISEGASSTKQPDNSNIHSPSAQEILKARYARGELTQEQYQQMLQTIQD